MILTFNPTLRTRTTLPILPNGGGSFRFTATFSRRTEYELARHEGTQVEMWTNLPVGGSASEWHALPFVFTGTEDDNASKGAPEALKLISLVSPTSTGTAAHEKRPLTAVLDISLASVRPGSTYSFTYRLVRPWGTIDWLGEYGQNGDLCFVEKDVRFSLADGCKFEGGTILSPEADADSAVVATLNNVIDWTCTGFSDNGCLVPSADLTLPPSSAALLVPRNLHGSVDVKPMLIRPENGAISVTSDGQLILHHATSLAVFVVDESHPLSDLVQQTLPGFEVLSSAGCFALIASRGKHAHELPAKISVVPVHRDAWAAPFTDVKLGGDVVCSLLGDFRGKEAVLANPSLGAFITVSCSDREDVSIRVSPAGAQAILAPLYDLVSSETEQQIRLALLSPASSTSVEIIESVNSLVLLTPPPSPPPVGRSAAFTAVTSTRPVPLLSVLTPPDECVHEALPIDDSYTPLTPTSPHDQEENEPVPDEAPGSVALIRHQGAHLARAGFLRFIVTFMAWLLEASYVKLCAILGSNLLVWITYKLSGINSRLGGSAQRPADKQGSSTAEIVQVHEETEDGEVSATETTLGEDEIQLDDAIELPPSTEEQPTAIGDVPLASPSPRESPRNAGTPLVHTPIAIQSPQPLRKDRSRFVADVHGDVATLLIRSQMKDAVVPVLVAIASGERIPVLVQRDEVVQLSADTHLLELRLPAGASRLEASLTRTAG